jgi:hypothetical protein
MHPIGMVSAAAVGPRPRIMQRDRRLFLVSATGDSDSRRLRGPLQKKNSRPLEPLLLPPLQVHPESAQNQQSIDGA